MKPMTSLGIDPSATATGLVLLAASGGPVPELIPEHEIKPKDMTGVQRSRFIVTGIMETIHQHKPDKVVMEGYSLNMKNKSSVIPLVELGGLIRFMLMIDGIGWYDPRASELKEFVSGKGNTPKDKMMMHVLKRWQHESETNNTADAYGLACIGLASANRLPGINQRMRAIAGGLPLRCN